MCCRDAELQSFQFKYLMVMCTTAQEARLYCPPAEQRWVDYPSLAKCVLSGCGTCCLRLAMGGFQGIGHRTFFP
jgi:hypothetical protein